MSKIKAALWQRLHRIQITLLDAYAEYAEAETDRDCLNATQTIQQARRDWRETSEGLRRAYGHNVLRIEGQDE